LSLKNTRERDALNTTCTLTFRKPPVRRKSKKEKERDKREKDNLRRKEERIRSAKREAEKTAEKHQREEEVRAHMNDLVTNMRQEQLREDLLREQQIQDDTKQASPRETPESVENWNSESTSDLEDVGNEAWRSNPLVPRTGSRASTSNSSDPLGEPADLLGEAAKILGEPAQRKRICDRVHPFLNFRSETYKH
jgi:hypothetical protein